jgi:hypothetical protein
VVGPGGDARAHAKRGGVTGLQIFAVPPIVCMACGGTGAPAVAFEINSVRDGKLVKRQGGKRFVRICVTCVGALAERFNQNGQAGIHPGPKGDENPPQESARLEPAPLPAAAPGHPFCDCCGTAHNPARRCSMFDIIGRIE